MLAPFVGGRGKSPHIPWRSCVLGVNSFGCRHSRGLRKLEVAQNTLLARAVRVVICHVTLGGGSRDAC